MQILRKEIRTGLLVVITLGILVAVILMLAAPGTFQEVSRYRIYFDNAAGINLGAPVLLAGRRIGQVASIQSPVPAERRPKLFPTYEVMIEVVVSAEAVIYRQVRVTLKQYGLLGEQVIDFAAGDPTSGIAPDGSYFVGERAKDFAEATVEVVQVVRDTVTPLAAQAEAVFAELQTTTQNLNRLTAPGSPVELTINEFREMGQNLNRLTGTEGPLRVSLENIERLTGDLVRDDRVNRTLRSFEQSAGSFKDTAGNLNRTINQVRPELVEITRNTRQATDTLKRQPWRLIWPSTKRYPEDLPKRRPPLRGDGKASVD